MEKRIYSKPQMKEKEVHTWNLALLADSPPPGGGEDPEGGSQPFIQSSSSRIHVGCFLLFHRKVVNFAYQNERRNINH